MTPRNAPCPCGSGEKYKRCCMPGRWHESPPVVKANDEYSNLRAASVIALVAGLGIDTPLMGAGKVTK